MVGLQKTYSKVPLTAAFTIRAGAAPYAGYFLLLGQKKVAKEKATRRAL
jgi:hypothetical protein